MPGISYQPLIIPINPIWITWEINAPTTIYPTEYIYGEKFDDNLLRLSTPDRQKHTQHIII